MLRNPNISRGGGQKRIFGEPGGIKYIRPQIKIQVCISYFWNLKGKLKQCHLRPQGCTWDGTWVQRLLMKSIKTRKILKNSIIKTTFNTLNWQTSHTYTICCRIIDFPIPDQANGPARMSPTTANAGCFKGNIKISMMPFTMKYYSLERHSFLVSFEARF